MFEAEGGFSMETAQSNNQGGQDTGSISFFSMAGPISTIINGFLLPEGGEGLHRSLPMCIQWVLCPRIGVSRYIFGLPFQLITCMKGPFVNGYNP
jgi:hypothetical protein